MKLNKPYKRKFKRTMLEALDKLITMLVETNPPGDDDRLLLSVLSEIQARIYAKLYNVQTEYQMSFTTAQAYALRLLYTDYINDYTTYLGNELHLISNEVKKHFNKI